MRRQQGWALLYWTYEMEKLKIIIIIVVKLAGGFIKNESCGRRIREKEIEK